MAKAIYKVKINGYKAKDIIEALKKVPEDYAFFVCGDDSDYYDLWVDSDNGMVSIERSDYIDSMIDELYGDTKSKDKEDK